MHSMNFKNMLKNKFKFLSFFFKKYEKNMKNYFIE